MRTHTKLAIALFLALAASSCGRDNTIAPVSSTAPEPHLFILTPDDPRLPAPGTEARAISVEDRALFDRVASRVEPRAPLPGAEAVVFWNRVTTELAAEAKLPPPSFARAYALVQVGIYEAVVASAERARNLPEHAVAAGVASRVLGHLFPAKAARIEEAIQDELALDGGLSGAAIGGWSFGRAVGAAVVARAKSDGSDAVFTGTPPTGDGIWTGTNPVLPMCGSWKTWVLESGSEIQPEPPYAYGSDEDLREVQEVLDVSLTRTAEQIAIVHKWADRSPPAIWNGMLNERIESQNLDIVTAARVQAYLNIAMTDAFIECWACKYVYWIARPFQRTPGLVTVIPTPNFPSYTSGHSTISAAAAAVLAEVFPSEGAFFNEQSEEAAMSRLYGGIHFRHDNEQGTHVGSLIGQRVVERMRAGKARELLARN